MFLLSLARIIKFSLQDVGRNIWLSVITITILILALFSVNMLLTVNVISNSAIEAVKEKIDVILYLKEDAAEDKAAALKIKISNLSQVKEVSYISKAEALKSFKAKHQDNPEILEALRELGKNPLTPSFVIKPQNADDYQALMDSLSGIDDDIIESRNFDDHKLMLEKINSITNKISEVGIFISFIFVLITLLLVYNSIRVAIYTHRREIKIMRLVGASNWFIRAPFLFSSIIYTLVGILSIIIIYYFFLSLLQPYLETFFIGYDINLLTYFKDNFVAIFGLQFIISLIVNVVASLFAVGKYSDV
ncbi:MAG: permease-like cell division protein FtsX [Candidatus Falkowbacteria bacterium]|nr:ABC transporter permease [Candidatus Parcubacteria bacterium]